MTVPKAALVALLVGAATAPSACSAAFTNNRISSFNKFSRSYDWVQCPPSSSLHRGRTVVSMSFLDRFRRKKEDSSVATLEKEAEVEEEVQTTMEVAAVGEIDDECVVPEEKSETERLLQQVKDAGLAGVISYALWELGFWALSIPVCVFGYYEVAGHWPDISNAEDMQKLGAEAFAFVNFARFAVPLRIGLALGTVPWIQENIVDKFIKKDEIPECTPEQLAAMEEAE